MDWDHENDLRADGYTRIAGFDEVGRGPLAGPLLTCGVILKPGIVIPGIADSKVLSAKKREALYPVIVANALAIALHYFTASEVDRLNPYRASLLGMEECARVLEPDYALTDDMPFPDLTGFPVEPLVKGDARIPSIACASIIAKVTRDRAMIAFDALYPGYGFAQNKGYGTAFHLAALAEKGVTVLHRKSYAPVARELEKEDKK